MHRPRLGSALSAAITIAALIPMLAAPAGAAVGCDAIGEFPSTFAAQSGLKIVCRSDAGDLVAGITVHDATNGDWHHGAARTFTMTGQVVPLTASATNPISAITFTGNQITADDIGRPISAFDPSVPTEVFPGGLFITSVSAPTATVSQAFTAPVAGPITATIEYTRNRWLTDAFCHANNPGNVIVRDLDHIDPGPAMTPSVASAGHAMSDYPGVVSTFTISHETVRIPSHGQILINTTGTPGVLHYTAFDGDSFTIDALVSGSGTPTGTTPVTWKQSTSAEFALGGTIYKLLTPKLPTVTALNPGNVTVANTTGLNSVYTYVNSAGTGPDSTVNTVNFTSGAGNILPNAQFNWTLAKVSAISKLTIAPLTPANGVSPMADFIAAGSPAVIEDSSGLSHEMLNWTGTSGNAFTGVSITGPNAATATVKQGYRITEAASNPNNTLTSASANFTSDDIGKSVSSGPFGAGVYISALDIAPISSTIATSVFAKTAHGLTNGDVISFGGLANTTGVSNATPYFVVNATANTFQVSLTNGGAAITLGGTTDASISVFTSGPVTSPTNQVTLATVDGSNPIQADCTKQSGGNLNSVHVLAPQDSSSAGTDSVDIGAATYDTNAPHAPELFPGTDPMSVELNNDVTPGPSGFTCTGSALTLTAAAIADFGGFTGGEVGLPIGVTDVDGNTDTGVIDSISTTSATNDTANMAVTVGGTPVPCPPAGVTPDALRSASAYVGGPSANGPNTGDVMMTLATEINLNPVTVPTADDCEPGGNHSLDTYEGASVAGSWTSPGPDYNSSPIAPIVTTAQVDFPTSLLVFDGWVQPQKSGADHAYSPDKPHYNLTIPTLPSGVTACLNDTPFFHGTPWNPVQYAFGVNATTLSKALFLPVGTGNYGDPSVRRLLPVTTFFAAAHSAIFGSGFHQIVNLVDPNHADLSGSPVTGPDCEIFGPTELPPVSLTTCGVG